MENEKNYIPYKYGYSLGNGKEYSENGYLVVYYKGERKEVNSKSVEFYQPYENGKLSRKEFNEIVKGTNGIRNIWGDFKEEYYTPSVEEFHVGFECEVSITTSHGQYENKVNWYPIVIGRKDRYSLLIEAEFHAKLKIDLNKFRVKYLDKEDIESLGFKFIEEDRGYCYYKLKIYRLTYNPKEHSLTIDNGEDYEQYNCYFEGTIKNISELKVLLKQIGIDG